MTTKTGMRGFASDECANWRDGGCIGADVANTFAMPLPKCLIGMGLPCGYFERCLLPLAKRRDETALVVDEYRRRINPLFKPGQGNRLVLAEHLDAVEDDALRAGLWRHPFIAWAKGMDIPVEVEQRRSCACGGALGKRERVCEKCRKERRRQSNRDAQSRKRVQTVMPVSS